MLSRRRYLTAIGTTSAIGLAGCSGDGSDGSDGGDDGEDCDDEACDQVTERLTEVTSTGTVDDGQIDAVELTLRPRLGEADSIDLDGVTVELITADTVFALVSDQVPSPPGDGVFSYRPIRDANSSIRQDGRLDDEGDMVLIMLGLDGAASANGSYVEAPLDAGDEPLVRIVTPEGAEAGVPLIVPDVLSGEQTVEL